MYIANLENGPLDRLGTWVHFLWGSILHGTYRIWTPWVQIIYGSIFYIIEYGPGYREYGPRVHFPWGPYSI